MCFRSVAIISPAITIRSDKLNDGYGTALEVNKSFVLIEPV
jgi:hypothetical protein